MADAVRAISGQGVGRRFMVLGLGEATARLVAFGTTVYLARTIGAESYGIIGFATAIMLYLSRIADCGIEYFGLGIRDIAENPGRITTMVPSVTTARVAVAGGLAAILCIVAVAVPQPDGAVIALYGLTLLALGASTRWVLLGLERPRVVAVSRIGSEALFATLVLLFVHSSADILRVPVSQFIGDAAAALMLAIVLWRSGAGVRMAFDWAIVRPVFQRSWRLVLSALLGLIIYNSDLILLRFFRDSASVGYYAAAYTFISFLLNLGGAYNQSLLPALTREPAGMPRDRGLYQTALAHVFAATLPIAIGGCFLARSLVPLIFGAEYTSSVSALEILVWSLPLALMREVATAALMARQGEGSVLRFTFWTALANLVLNLILIPRFGMVGAAVATVVTEGVRFTAALALARALGFEPVNPARLWRPVLAATMMGAVVVISGRGETLLSMTLGAGSYVIVLALVGGIRIRRGQLPELTV